MSYFVTGATGFIGSHLISRLLDRKGNIYVLVRRASKKKFEAHRKTWGRRADSLRGQRDVAERGSRHIGGRDRGRAVFRDERRRRR